MNTLSVDPGIRIGIALFRPDGSEIYREVIDWDELESCLWGGSFRSIHLGRIVVEDFVNDPKRGARGGQHNDASEVIGMLRYFAGTYQIEFIRQQASCLSAAKLWAGYEQKQKHLPDQDSAYLHGFFRFVKDKVLQPVPL